MQAFTTLTAAQPQVIHANATTFLLDEDAALWVCGQNESGQLGLGDTNHRNTLTQLI